MGPDGSGPMPAIMRLPLVLCRCRLLPRAAGIPFQVLDNVYVMIPVPSSDTGALHNNYNTQTQRWSGDAGYYLRKTRSSTPMTAADVGDTPPASDPVRDAVENGAEC